MRRLVLAAAVVSLLIPAGILLKTHPHRASRSAAAPASDQPAGEEPALDEAEETQPAEPSPPALPPVARRQPVAETRPYAPGQPGVVVNEILFHPRSGEAADEWIELWNRGAAAADLSGFRLDGPIKFVFPAGTAVDSGAYLVVAADRDRARSALGLNGILGNWTGKLKRSGGTIRLRDASGTEVVAVPYGDLPPMPAGGPGISLELRNPHGDPAFAGNWGSCRSGGWTLFRAEGTATSNRLYFYLGGAGTVWVDDIAIRPLPSRGGGGRRPPGPEANLALNGGFEDGRSAWSFSGNHAGSRISAEVFHSGKRCLEIVSTGPGSTRSTSVWCEQPNLVQGQRYLLEFWALFAEPSVPLTARFSGSRQGTDALSIEVRPGGSTPGKVNSLYCESVPPFIYPVHPSTEMPAPGEEVTILAAVSSGPPLKEVVLHYDAGKGERTVGLATGAGGWSARIGPFPAGTLVTYYVTAEDQAGGKGRFPFEGNPTRRLGLVVETPDPGGNLPAYRLYLSRGALGALDRNALSDAYQSGAFACGGRVYCDVGFRYRGQTSRYYPKHHWKVKFNRDDPLVVPGSCPRHAVKGLDLNSSYGDKSFLREVLGYRLLRDLGEPTCDAFHSRVYLNGAYLGLYISLENPGGDYLHRNGLEEGWLWKSYSSEQPGRGSFELKAGDPSTAGAVLDEFLTQINSLGGQALEDYLRAHLDPESLASYLAACQLMHNTDPVEKNHFLYADRERRFRVLTWDLDLTHGRNFECSGGGLLNDYLRHDMWDADTRDNALLFGTRVHPKCGGGVNAITDAFLYRTKAFRAVYYRRLAEGLSCLYHPDVLIPKVERLRASIGEEALRDRRRWPSYGGDQDVEAQQELLIQWIRERYDHLRKKLAGLGYKVEEPLNADFEAGVTTGTAPLSVSFQNFSMGKIASWEWDFGDGEKSDAKEPTHVYSKSDCYTVTLKVTGPGGRTHREARRHMIHVR